MFTDEQIKELQAPLDGSLVKTREQAGRSLSYIEGWSAIDSANRIFGHGNWSYLVNRLEFIGQRDVTNRSGREGWEVAYYAVVHLNVGDAHYEDTGYGSGTDYNSPFSAHESATKEAVTDALKRCFKNLGYVFGLALYDKTQEHVDRGEGEKQPESVSLVQPPATDEDRKGFEDAMTKLGFAVPHTRNKAAKMSGQVYMEMTRAELASVYKAAKAEVDAKNGGEQE